MLFANGSLACALLSKVYELHTRAQITWCGICATFRGFDVSHRRIASVSSTVASQASFSIADASQSLTVVQYRLVVSCGRVRHESSSSHRHTMRINSHLLLRG